MFPWVWSPRLNISWISQWPGGGDVKYGDWTNSLLTVRQAAALVNTHRIAAVALHRFPMEVAAALGYNVPADQLANDLSIVEDLINRSSAR